MASSQKKFTPDSKETKELEFEAPANVMNLILGHGGYNETLSGFGQITLFN